MMRLQNRFDRFFLGRIDERTGVYYQDIGILCARDNFHSTLQNTAEHDLRIDQVLGTAEADHANLRFTDRTDRFSPYLHVPGKKTSNIEHRMLNLRRSMFGVGCWAFSVFNQPLHPHRPLRAPYHFS
jgi:hypothetical protein